MSKLPKSLNKHKQCNNSIELNVKRSAQNGGDRVLKLRTPNQLPAPSQWAREGDEAFYRSLVKQGKMAEAIYFLAFLEATYGCNPSLFSDNASVQRAAYTAVDANNRDVMNASRIESVDAPSGPKSKRRDSADNTLLAQRSKQHIDSCDPGNGVNRVEDALNDLIDHHDEVTSNTRRGNVTLVKPVPIKGIRKRSK